MPLLLESLRAVDGRLEHLGPHMDRMDRSCRKLFGCPAPDLNKGLEDVFGRLGTGIWKIRVLYECDIRGVEAAPYRPKAYGSAILVDGGNVDYAVKTAERPELDALTRRARAAGGDTALIVKGGLITDFSYANAAFFDGADWWTPAAPLLEGTRRARLLADGRIKVRDISVGDIGRYLRVSPINAMLDLDEVRRRLSILCR